MYRHSVNHKRGNLGENALFFLAGRYQNNEGFGAKATDLEHQGGQAMGRGRAKAKQTKVARQLKYSSPDTDFERLQRELSGSAPAAEHKRVDEEDDDYTDWR